ncbi:hypothetical protein A2V71_01655 [Candidatus Berkelbacteria bacterium RBG_13_40_8]|uniref:Acylphosphatase n=1 Tax=Candidatus Berkelbacteria bacterium RBG_13_40_8 TaxID=1797467 RepID=A0A1F5DQ33_9BACT|nr:MAG: hypothetical protein A2V71_01655 [Candidatus Berkelbacteria bacterium RBG_13_40_8]
MSISRLKIAIHGQVQGVFFRAEIQQIAEGLNLTGFAKNLDDGSVGVVAEGDKENLEKLLEWCHKGSDLARVTKVESSWGEPIGEFEGFQVKY